MQNPEAILLIAADRGVERVACACEAAAAAGVRHGMTVAHARSLLAGRRVQTAPHRPEDVARALDRMVQWAFRFSPVVTADYPDGLLLDISGCAHLYAGEEKLAKSVVAALEQWRIPARACVAPTAATARAVARYTQERITVIPDHAAGDELRFLPVSALGVEPAIRNALAEIGVVSIDQLLNLPREDLAPRFGAALLSRIDHALGLAHELIEPARPIEPMEFKRTFEGAITNQEAIFLAVEQLLRDMIVRLARDESGVSRMSFKFFRINERASPLTKGGYRGVKGKFEIRNSKFEEMTKLPDHQIAKPGPDIALSLSFPTRDFKHLWSLLRPRLERVHLGYGVEEIVLRALHAQRLLPIQMDLWPDAASPTHRDNGAVLGQWLDQVIERIGRRAVVEMRPAERYLPEEAFLPCVVHQADGTFSSLTRKGGGENQRIKTSSKFEVQNSKKDVYPATRPSKLFSLPQHARVIALVPDGPPGWIQWQGREEPVACGYGPERICGPWWDGTRQQGNEAMRQRGKEDTSSYRHTATSPYLTCASRDYFVIHTEPGLWLWVYRDCVSGEWFVHGEWS